MNVQITSTTICKTITTEENENDFYQKVAQVIADIQTSDSVFISCPYGTAEYCITPRSGTFFVREASNNINFSDKGNYPPVYLVCVNADKNNYKFYKLEQKGNDVIATYGRIGVAAGEMFGERTYTYPSRMFWIKYHEKLAKGYQDKTDVYLNKPQKTTPTQKKTQQPDTISDILYQKLAQCSRQIIQENCVSEIVTEKMVKESKKILKAMYERKTVKGFNTKLLELLAISPRKTNDVKQLLAVSAAQFPNIIQREENLISAMEGIAGKQAETGGFEKSGIEVYLATDKQKEQVLAKLTPNLAAKVKNVYRVINQKHKKTFDLYLKKENIHTVKQFWHGSRNENWLSIIMNGLSLRPNAVITGKMFGNGIYFAPSCEKSWNYTSYRGTYWAKGTSNNAYMGLYATAYGSPLDVYNAHSYSQNTLQGKNCVHAHAGTQLRNDEIVFYAEDAMVLNYIVEFE